MTTTKHDELGTLSTTPNGEPELRFERRLRHPIERVWAALTDPRELAAWFPAANATEWRPAPPSPPCAPATPRRGARRRSPASAPRSARRP